MGRISKKLLLQLGFASLLLVCIPPLVHIVNPMSYMNMQGISIFNGMSWFVGYYFIKMCRKTPPLQGWGYKALRRIYVSN